MRPALFCSMELDFVLESVGMLIQNQWGLAKLSPNEYYEYVILKERRYRTGR